MVHALEHVSGLADAVLVGRLEHLVRADRALSAKLLVHLGEVRARELYLERGYSSMFEYCRSGLGMSEAEAGLRILAAGVGRRFPLVIERLAAGAVHLTAIKLLAPHLTAENHVQLLDRARGRTKRQVEVLVADLAPKADVPARMRKLPERRSAAAKAVASDGAAPMFAESSNTAAIAASGSTAPVTGSETLLELQPKAAQAEPKASTFALESPRPRASSTPLGRGRFGLHVTLGEEAHGALEQLVELLRHQNPSGDFTRIVERALCELLKREMKRRFGHTNVLEKKGAREPASAELAQQFATSTPTPVASAPKAEVEPPAKREVISRRSRYIPRSVLREVYARDNGQCTYVSPEGRRCDERGFLEVHHHNTTFARGGDATAENLRLTCRAHNLFYAERDYGRGFMQSKLHGAALQQQ